MEAYFGGECDGTGACPGDYRFAVIAWSDHYAGPVSNPTRSGIAVLASDWIAPAIAPYQGMSPRPIQLPPGVVAPTTTIAPGALPTPTLPPTETPEVTRTVDEPGEGEPVEPTASPTQTDAPTSTPIVAKAP